MALGQARESSPFSCVCIFYECYIGMLIYIGIYIYIYWLYAWGGGRSNTNIHECLYV